MIPHARASLALALVAALAVSCSDSADEPEVPPLPPLASMELDLALFDGEAQASPEVTSVLDATAATQQNFAAAALRVAVINGTVALVMAVPVATFAAAVSTSPVLGDDGRYHWVYTVQHGGQTFAADLAGFLDHGSQESVWEMRLSVSGPSVVVEDFLWYDGRAAFGHGSGRWRIYDPSRPSTHTELLRVDWTRASEQEATLVFNNVAPGAQGSGDRLTYETSGEERTITFLDQSEGTTLEIGWSAVTSEGYLIAPLHNNGEKACWDAQREDVPCAP